MKRILFLDDNKHRHRTIKPYLLHDEAFTAGEAIKLLQDKQYDIVFLDHDLGESEMVFSFSEEETGYTVAKWIAENKPKIPLVVVHSLNYEGSNNIACLLKNHDYYVLQQMFTELPQVVDDILAWEPPVE